MPNTFAIADIHGRVDLLKAAVDRIETSDGGTVVFLGDYVDRGPDSDSVIEFLMAGPRYPNFKWICLAGNHEAMMLSAVADVGDRGWWIGCGGDATLDSYGVAKGHRYEPHGMKKIPPDHLRWMGNLPFFHEDAHRVFVHAGVNGDHVDLKDQSVEMLQWYRYAPGDDTGYRGKHVVHGHTPQKNGPVLLKNRTNLDVGAVFYGRISIGIFDDDVAGGPIDVVSIRMDP